MTDTHNNEMGDHSTATDLGTFFYPTHCVWAAFSNSGDAQSIRDTLITQGYTEKDCCVFDSDEVIERSKRDLEENAAGHSTATRDKHSNCSMAHRSISHAQEPASKSR